MERCIMKEKKAGKEGLNTWAYQAEIIHTHSRIRMRAHMHTHTHTQGKVLELLSIFLDARMEVFA